MGITHRFAQQAFDAFNRKDFEVGTVAGLLCNSSSPMIKVMAFKLATGIIQCLALDYDYGNFGADDEETRAIIKSRALADILDSYDTP
jgi:hypothetical protein